MSNQVFKQIKDYARTKLHELVEGDRWTTLHDLRDLIGRELDKYLVREHPTHVIDQFDVVEVRVAHGISMFEIELTIIRTDVPIGWASALLVEEQH